MDHSHLTRRGFLIGAASLPLLAADDRIIDIHQHTNYSGRSDEDLFAHQRTMGITTTILLPAGSKYGLAADAGGNDTVVDFAKRHPGAYLYFANEVPDLPEASTVIRKYLEMGAIGIGEQKFPVACDSIHIQRIAELAQTLGVPVLLHFEHRTYNFGFERFYKILEKYPKVNFIGHAQTWWGNIDKNLEQTVLYPKTRVTAHGITDRYLSDYPNMYGDLSAGSGLNALLRDEDHAREFLARHQNKLLYGSDCSDKIGQGPACSGSQCIAAVKRLAPDQKVARKLLHDNAASLFRLKA
jgi:predicted TIM-barrel fold metal-dependent hydrolase